MRCVRVARGLDESELGLLRGALMLLEIGRLVFSNSKRRLHSRADGEDLSRFLLTGLVVGPYLIFLVVVVALIL